MTCENCGDPINNPRPGQRFCSPSCRAEGWRREHITLGDLRVACPHCGERLHALRVIDGVPNAAREVF